MELKATFIQSPYTGRMLTHCDRAYIGDKNITLRFYGDIPHEFEQFDAHVYKDGKEDQGQYLHGTNSLLPLDDELFKEYGVITIYIMVSGSPRDRRTKYKFVLPVRNH